MPSRYVAVYSVVSLREMEQGFAVIALTAAGLISLSGAELIPEGFSCTRDMPIRSGIYSSPANLNSVKVDLIHVLCGQITEKNGAGGFHARPGDQDPESASTSGSKLSKRPANEYDFSVYKKPCIYDIREGAFVTKSSSSSVWPTVLSMEELTRIITYLVDQCRYYYV